MSHGGERWTLGKMQNPVRGLMHGGAAVLSVVGGVLLWRQGSADFSRQLALLVFATSLVSLYAVSSLYHSIPWSEIWKSRLQRLDHAMIYVLVAGTYTPLCFIVLDGWLSGLALATTWGIAAVGIGQKAFFPRLGHWFSVPLQILQGWLAAFLIVPLSQKLPWPALLLVILGGVLYTLGLVFYLTRRPRLWPRVFSYHEMFHVCVVGGSVAHYAMTLSYLTRFTGA